MTAVQEADGDLSSAGVDSGLGSELVPEKAEQIQEVWGHERLACNENRVFPSWDVKTCTLARAGGAFTTKQVTSSQFKGSKSQPYAKSGYLR